MQLINESLQKQDFILDSNSVTWKVLQIKVPELLRKVWTSTEMSVKQEKK